MSRACDFATHKDYGPWWRDVLLTAGSIKDEHYLSFTRPPLELMGQNDDDGLLFSISRSIKPQNRLLSIMSRVHSIRVK